MNFLGNIVGGGGLKYFPTKMGLEKNIQLAQDIKKT